MKYSGAGLSRAGSLRSVKSTPGPVFSTVRPNGSSLNLIESLRQFDGKRTDALEHLNSRLPRNDDTVRQLLAIAEHDDARLQVAATWILKKWLDDGTPPVEKSAETIVQLLKSAACWEARLHLLQMLVALRIPARSITVLVQQMPDLLADDNKFVRAWALSVFAQIADQREEFRPDVNLRIDAAGNDDAASVLARVRQIQKRYKWAAETGRTNR